MPSRAKQLFVLASLVMTLAAALWVITPALAGRGDYGVNTGSTQSTPERLQPTDTRVAPPPTATPPPPTNTPVPPPPTAVPATAVPTQHPDCKPGHYLHIDPDGSGACLPIPS